MPFNPKANEEKMNKMLSAWRTPAPTKSFGGMQLADFEAVVNDSMQSRTVVAAEDSRTHAIAARDDADDVFLQKAQLVVNGVLADPSEGDDSAIYEAMGYIRKSDRQSGLTRKKPEAARV